MTTPMQKRNRVIAVLALAAAAVGFGVITIGGIGENLVYYWGPTELHAAGKKAQGATIRLGGQVAPKSIQLVRGSELQFDVTDGKSKVRVVSSGVPPQMFREGIGVVVEGTMTPGGFFRSNRLMVSHSNEYKAPDSGENADPKKLMETTRGIVEDAATKR